MEGFAGFADSLRGHSGGEFQFFEAQCAEAGAIEAELIEVFGLEMQPAQGDVLDGQQQIGLALDKQRFVRAAEIDLDLRLAGFAAAASFARVIS